jgi:hypothetical protein
MTLNLTPATFAMKSATIRVSGDCEAYTGDSPRFAASTTSLKVLYGFAVLVTSAHCPFETDARCVKSSTPYFVAAGMMIGLPEYACEIAMPSV